METEQNGFCAIDDFADILLTPFELLSCHCARKSICRIIYGISLLTKMLFKATAVCIHVFAFGIKSNDDSANSAFVIDNDVVE